MDLRNDGPGRMTPPASASPSPIDSFSSRRGVVGTTALQTHVAGNSAHPHLEDSVTAASAPRFGAIRSGVKLGLAAVIVIMLAPFAMNLSHLLEALPNPFATEKHEAVQPPVLKSLQDL